MNMPDDLRLSKNVKRHVTGKNSPHSRWRSCVHLWNVVIIAFACLLTTSTASSLHTSKSVINNVDVPTVQTHSRGLSIFGVDDRKPVSDASLFPYSSVGLLQWNSDHICTATLIGSRFAVTAAECVLSPDGKELASTKPQFRVGLGASAVNAKINKIHRQSDFWKKWTEDTYVILELDSALGDTLGKVLLPVLEDLDQSVGKTFVQMVGFDEDAVKATAASPPILKFSKCTCYFPASFNGPQYLIHHDCDTSVKGSPGTPLFVRYTSMDTYIIGIHTNVIDGAKVPETSATFPTFTDANANRGVLGPFIQKHLVALESGNNSTIAKDEPGSTNTSTPRTTSDKQGQDGSDKEIKSKSDGSISNENQNSKKTLSPSVAYVAIGLVGGAWVCILFIVLRHIRRGKPQQ